MKDRTNQITEMVDMLPEQEQDLAYELTKRIVLAWDPDYTELTPTDIADIEQARAEYARGEYVNHNDINWD